MLSPRLYPLQMRAFCKTLDVVTQVRKAIET
jgi:hypothetical protein